MGDHETHRRDGMIVGGLVVLVAIGHFLSVPTGDLVPVALLLFGVTVLGAVVPDLDSHSSKPRQAARKSTGGLADSILSDNHRGNYHTVVFWAVVAIGVAVGLQLFVMPTLGISPWLQDNLMRVAIVAFLIGVSVHLARDGELL